jgi:hypothetical protein
MMFLAMRRDSIYLGPFWLRAEAGVYQTHANKNLGVSMRGTSFGLERSDLCGTAIGFARGWEGDARARDRGSQGQ